MKGTGPSVPPILMVVLIVCLVAAAALQPSVATPPAVAELSPQAVASDPPEDSDDPTLAPDATGDGGSAPVDPGAAAPVTTPPAVEQAPTTTVAPDTTAPPTAVRRRCVPNGDGTARQTEDPQSPPCVPFSDFDSSNNGGATWQGVTADKIVVAVGAFGIEDGLPELEAHFNDRYEFHGRRIELVKTTEISWHSGNSPQEVTAAAVAVDEEFGAFASTGFSMAGPGDDLYFDELTRREVITIGIGGAQGTSADIAAAGPYQWNLYPAYDVQLAAKADLMCEHFAPGSGVGGTGGRTYGFIYSQLPDGSDPDFSPLLDGLAACGIEPAQVRPSAWNESHANYAFPTDTSNQMMQEFRALGISTIISEANPIFESALWSSAELIRYRPEWLLSPFFIKSSGTMQSHPAAAQSNQSFFMNPADRYHSPAEEPYNQLLAEYDEAYDDTLVNREVYQAVMVLAAGIQGAGPDLTPQTFAAALESTTWANQGTGAPLHQASFDLRGDHTAYSDWTLSWFDTLAPAPENGRPAAICYLDGGARFALADLPGTATATLGDGCD